MADYALLIGTPEGALLAHADSYARLEYALVNNAVGACVFTLPGTFDRTLLHKDGRVGVMRSVNGGPLHLDGKAVWFIRGVDVTNDGHAVEVTAYHANYLLTSRIVAYKPGTAKASQSDEADNMMKAVVLQNLGSGADETARSIDAYLDVAASTGAGPFVSLDFAHREVLSVLQDISQEAAEEGTNVLFGIEAPTFDTLLFRTSIDYWGQDRSGHVVLSPERGNLQVDRLSYDWSEEATVVYAVGQGSGEGMVRRQATDPARIAESPFARREVLRSVSSSSVSVVGAEAAAELRNRRPRKMLHGTVLQSPGTQYGREYMFGDRVSWEAFGENGTAVVDAVTVTVEGGSESISIGLRVEE